MLAQAGWTRHFQTFQAKFDPFYPNFWPKPSIFDHFWQVFLPFFLRFLPSFSGHFWTIVKGQSPLSPPVNLGHSWHTLGYFREIYDRNIRVNSLEILGTGGTILVTEDPEPRSTHLDATGEFFWQDRDYRDGTSMAEGRSRRDEIFWRVDWLETSRPQYTLPGPDFRTIEKL